MKEYVREFLEEQKEKRPTYRDMIEFCCESLVLNNYIIPETTKNNYYWELYAGTDYDEENEEYIDVYQYYIISGGDAERLATYTNEIVYYNEDLDLFVLGVTHFGTSWAGVPANWKDTEEEMEGEDND